MILQISACDDISSRGMANIRGMLALDITYK